MNIFFINYKISPTSPIKVTLRVGCPMWRRASEFRAQVGGHSDKSQRDVIQSEGKKSE